MDRVYRAYPPLSAAAPEHLCAVQLGRDRSEADRGLGRARVLVILSPHPEEPCAAWRLEGQRKSAVADLRVKQFRSRVNPRSVAGAALAAILRDGGFAASS